MHFLNHLLRYFPFSLIFYNVPVPPANKEFWISDNGSHFIAQSGKRIVFNT